MWNGDLQETASDFGPWIEPGGGEIRALGVGPLIEPDGAPAVGPLIEPDG